MKSVMISIRPQHCDLIASGEKTIEVRKTKPKIKCPFRCYIYECNWKDNTMWSFKHKGRLGKVIGEFVCDSIIQIDCDSVAPFDYETKEYVQDALCMGRKEIIDYAGFTRPYGWHIADPVIYEKPKELSDFKPLHRRECVYSDLGFAIPKCDKCHDCGLKRPPKSWCYVEEVR